MFSFIKSNKQYSLIFRPHPLLFQNFLATGELTQEAFSSLIKDIEDTPNIYLDESGDYLDSFNKSNMLITDTSGLIIDYYLTGKPIIFCGIENDFPHLIQKYLIRYIRVILGTIFVLRF